MKSKRDKRKPMPINSLSSSNSTIANTAATMELDKRRRGEAKPMAEIQGPTNPYAMPRSSLGVLLVFYGAIALFIGAITFNSLVAIIPKIKTGTWDGVELVLLSLLVLGIAYAGGSIIRMVKRMRGSPMVLPSHDNVVRSVLPQHISTTPGENLPVQLHSTRGTSQERMRHVSIAMAVYVLAMSGIVVGLGIIYERWDLVLSPWMVVPGLVGVALLYHLVKHANIALRGARTVVEIGGNSVKRGQTAYLRIAQYGRLELETIEVRLVCMLKDERKSANRSGLHDTLIWSEQNVSLSGVFPWVYSTTIQIPPQAQPTGQHGVDAQVTWGIQYKARGGRRLMIEAMYPFEVR